MRRVEVRVGVPGGPVREEFLKVREVLVVRRGVGVGVHVEEAVEAETEEAGTEPLDAPDPEEADVTEPGDEAEQAEPEAREGPRFVLETGDEDEQPVEPEPEDEPEPELEPETEPESQSEAESESEMDAGVLEADAEAGLAGDDAPEEEAGADIGIAIGDDADGATAEADGADAVDAVEAAAVADALGSETPEGPSPGELRARPTRTCICCRTPTAPPPPPLARSSPPPRRAPPPPRCT